MCHNFIFIGLIILHCMDTTHLIIHSQLMDILICFPPFVYCEYCCYEHLCTGICLSTCFLWKYIPGSGITGSYGNSMFSFLRNHQTDFHSGCTILNFHQQCHKEVAISLDHCQHLFPFKNYSHPNGCEVLSFLLASP